MNMIQGMREQLVQELRQQGLLGPHQGAVHAASKNAADPGIVRSVLACGLYPQIARLKFLGSGGGAEGRSRGGRYRPQVLTRKAEKVQIHVSSVNSSLQPRSAEDVDEGEAHPVAPLAMGD